LPGGLLRRRPAVGGELPLNSRGLRQLWAGFFTARAEYAVGVYAALGDKDEAFRIPEKAVEERSTFIVSFKEDLPFENLRSDPLWKILLRRTNFPEE
jgi:hypothetical protein